VLSDGVSLRGEEDLLLTLTLKKPDDFELRGGTFERHKILLADLRQTTGVSYHVILSRFEAV